MNLLLESVLINYKVTTAIDAKSTAIKYAKAMFLLALLASGALGWVEAGTVTETETLTKTETETDQTSDADIMPQAPSSSNSATQSSAPVDQAEAPSSPANNTNKPQVRKPSRTKTTRTFKPTEKISEDYSVPFPVDI